MGGLFSKGGGKRARDEVWRQESEFENRLQQGHADTWGGVTSYNLLDIQQGDRDSHSAPHHQPLDTRYGNVDQKYDFNFGTTEDSACPPNYRPNPAKPPIEKNYYKSPKKVKSRSQNSKNRPEWISDIDPSRKQSINSEISTVELRHETVDAQTFKTPVNPSKNMREPSKPSRGSKDNRRSSEPSVSVKPPSNKKEDTVDYSYLDKYKPPPQYMTNRERQELLRIKQEKERNNNNHIKYESSKPRYPYQSDSKPSDIPASNNKNNNNSQSQSIITKSSSQPAVSLSPPPKQKSPKKKSLISQTERIVHKPGPDPSQLYAVPNKKTRSRSNILEPPKSTKSESSSKSSSRTSSTSTSQFSDLNGIKSATLSVASSASNFSVRTKVISFNDRKQSLGSIGMATITKVENNFKVRQFPDGAKQGWSKAQSLIGSDDWERTVEGLEMLASLARQHHEVLESDSKTLRNVMLKSVKNLRSQVCRAAIQAVQVVFLNVGKSLETDSDSLVKELLQKSSDTNKFIRSDSKKALDLMAENFSVYKVISLVLTGFQAQKNVVIRSNSADIVDSVITRLGAERFMGSSTELQDLVMGEGSKMLIDAASEVRASARHYWAELVQHAKTEPMLKQALTEVEMRNINKTLQSLK